jgi:hypothetical protein
METAMVAENSDSRLNHDIILQVAITLMLASSSINPFVYFLRSKRLRSYSKKLFIKIKSSTASKLTEITQVFSKTNSNN